MDSLYRMRVASVGVLLTLAPHGLLGQPSVRGGAATQARRVDERIRALEREGDQLAGQARTLLGDLRRLEIQRDLETERLAAAQAAVEEAQRAAQDATERLAVLEAQRIAQLPDLRAQLVDLYTRGRTGYVRLMFGASDVRAFTRATRVVAALVRINARRVAEHRTTIQATQEQRAALEEQVQKLQAGEADARKAQVAAARAVAARAALVARIDARRDLNAQLAGELQVAFARLQEQVANLGAGRAVEPVSVPLIPFRGTLDWPVAGRVTGRFGQIVGRFGAPAARRGIEIAAPRGTSVRAVHPGTVTFTGPFTGFGNLVIIDHGADTQTLYGYLSSTAVREGDAVDQGAEVGRAGSAPAGPSALYFEMRVDGRSVDPVQWLRAR